jgi:hypothetical protein
VGFNSAFKGLIPKDYGILVHDAVTFRLNFLLPHFGKRKATAAQSMYSFVGNLPEDSHIEAKTL